MSDVSTSIGRRYGGKTAHERRAERRRQLLDAGLELFGTAGYAATTIEQLCATARLHPRYFYEQFQSRAALLQGVYDRHVEAVLVHVTEAIDRAPREPRERLQAGLTAFVDATVADERAARINYFEMVGVSPQLERRRREVLRTYADLVATEAAALQPKGSRPGVDLRLAAVALVGSTDGLIIDWLSHEPRADRAQIISTLLTTFAPII
jgi:AcrR family transcriptional regulator